MLINKKDYYIAVFNNPDSLFYSKYARYPVKLKPEQLQEIQEEFLKFSCFIDPREKVFFDDKVANDRINYIYKSLNSRSKKKLKGFKGNTKKKLTYAVDLFCDKEKNRNTKRKNKRKVNRISRIIDLVNSSRFYSDTDPPDVYLYRIIFSLLIPNILTKLYKCELKITHMAYDKDLMVLREFIASFYSNNSGFDRCKAISEIKKLSLSFTGLNFDTMFSDRELEEFFNGDHELSFLLNYGK